LSKDVGSNPFCSLCLCEISFVLIDIF